MFERFSSSYYLGRLYVQPSTDKRTTLCRAQYERVHGALYEDNTSTNTTGASADDTNAGGATAAGSDAVSERPLVMKLDTAHLPVCPATNVPADTLAVPPAVLEETSIRHPPTLSEVFLATADRAAQLLSLSRPARPARDN